MKEMEAQRVPETVRLSYSCLSDIMEEDVAPAPSGSLNDFRDATVMLLQASPVYARFAGPKNALPSPHTSAAQIRFASNVADATG